MDINENLLQTNTFVGGMNTDTSDSMMDNKQYRFAKNLRITTNKDLNSGELHLIEGTVKSECISNIENLENCEIIASTSIRNYGIIILKCPTETENFVWCVYRFTNKERSAEKLFGPCETPIWDENNIPCLLTRYESEDNIKLYIADGIHQLMSINIANVPDQSDTPKEIEALYGHVNTTLSPLNVSISDNSGSLKSAKVQYCYRLYKEHGSATKLSSLSKILSLYKNSNSGYRVNRTTGRSVKIQIPNDPYTNVDKILIFRINYIENGLAPEVYMIKDQKYVPGQSIIDTGMSNIQSIAISELLSYMSLGVIPKIIESKNDYLFAANIKYIQSEVDELFEDIDTRSFSSGVYIKNGETKTYVTTLEEFPELSETLYHDSFVEGEYISWREEDWKDKEGNIGGYGKYFNWSYDYIENTIDQNNLADDYKLQISGLRPEEVYRFGVILYDKKGNASSVKWIADILMPNQQYTWKDQYDTNIEIIKQELTETSYNPLFKVKNFTITFTLNEDIPNCSRYEIVRCLRTLDDRCTITEGLIGHPLRLYKQNSLNEFVSTNNICPSGFITLDHINVSSETLRATPDRSILQFASPEYCYQEDDMKDILDINTEGIQIVPVKEYSVYTRNWENTSNSYYLHTINNSLFSDTMPIGFYPGKQDKDGIYLNYNWSVGKYNHDKYMSLVHETDQKLTSNFYNYIQPAVDIVHRITNIPVSQISDISYPKVPAYNTFSTGEVIRFLDDITNLKGSSYIAWSAPLLLEDETGSESVLYKALTGKSDFVESNFSKILYGIGTSGKCILFKLKDEYEELLNSLISYGIDSGISFGSPTITIADIRKKTVPYGGYNKESIKSSVYYSYGNNFENKKGSHTFIGGDCYYNMFLYSALHNWFDKTFYCCNRMSTVYNVPVISDIDLHGKSGFLFNPSGEKRHYLQDTATSFEGYVQDEDLYVYNTAYNSYPDVIAFSAYDEDDLIVDNSSYDTRVHYSELKTNGESIDNWVQFKTANFLDVDSRFGSITNIKLFKDKLIYWQKDATGLLAVNERIILNDANDTHVVLGTGSVLERYDYFTTLYGMKPNQFVNALSDNSLYWWDGEEKEILQYTDKYAVTPITTTKYIKNYINEGNESNKPTIFYDSDNKEIVCNCVNNESVVYSEQILQFSSIYEFASNCNIKLNNIQYVFDINTIYKYNEQKDGRSNLFNNPVYPYIKYIVNHNSNMNKTYDIQTMGGRLYGGDNLEDIQMTFKTPLKQEGRIIDGKGITNREYDFRLNVPRAGIQSTSGWIVSDFGDRLRGKIMQCELLSTNNSTDFSLQYITTKFRISWS